MPVHFKKALKAEIQKLKKVIEILKKQIAPSKIIDYKTRYLIGTYYNAPDLTKEEYELINEVFNNE